MDQVEQKYWSMYMDFIDSFKQLTYKGIPLPLLSEKIYTMYSNPYFLRKLHLSQLDQFNNKVIIESQVQPYFDRIINTIPKSRLKPLDSFNVLIFNHAFLDILPLNKDFSQYINPSEQVMIRELEKGTLTHSKDSRKFRVDIGDISNEYSQKAEEIFHSFSEHTFLGDSQFQKSFFEDIPIILNRIAAVAAYFDQVPIASVVLGETSAMLPRIFALIASIKGIPTVCIQHGLMIGKIPAFPLLTTKHGVYSDIEKEIFSSYGVQKDKIVLTGHPRFDSNCNIPIVSKQEFYKNFNLDPQNKTILFPTNTAINLAFLHEALEKIAMIPDYQIIIKPHHREVSLGLLGEYEKICKKHTKIKLIIGATIYDCITNSDIVAIQSSTAGIESMMYGKTTVFYKNMNEQNYFDDMGEFIQLSPSELVKVICSLINHNDVKKRYEDTRNKFIAKHCPVKDSGRIVAELILNL